MVAKSDRVIDAIEKLANDVGVAADCPSATAALRGHRDAMRAIMADADELEKRWSAADDAGKQWFETTYRPRFAASSHKMMTRASTCKSDPAFKAAFDEVNSSHR